MRENYNQDFYPFGLRGRRDLIDPMESSHRHTEIELFSMRGGTYTRKFGEQTEQFSEDEIIVFWGCIPHQLLEKPDRGEGYIAYFPLETFLRWQLPSRFVHQILGGSCLRIPISKSVSLAFEALQHWLPTSGKTGSGLPKSEQMIIEGCLGVIAKEALKNAPVQGEEPRMHGSDHHVSRMIEFVVHNRCEPIVAEDICKHAGLHSTYGRTLFKNAVGISLHQFLTNYRLEHSKNLLANSDALILDVALESGFGSVSRFHAIFKSKIGMTPRAFRQSTQDPS
ncbi:MAG: helix-turn-helix domain-containing protein [Verrucomicrobiota bacterium]